MAVLIYVLHLCGIAAYVPAVITIPILMLWNVQISLRKKLALMGIFSLTVIVMVVAIVRVAVVTTKNTNADISWLYFWSNIEIAVGICTPPPHPPFRVQLDSYSQSIATHSYHSLLPRLLPPTLPQPEGPQIHQTD